MNDIKTLIIEIVSPDLLPMQLLLEADPSERQVRSYLVNGRCYRAVLDGQTVAVCVLKGKSDGVCELMNIAVDPALQRLGAGSKLLQFVIDDARCSGVCRLELGTGTFGYQLAFYQKAGFRVESVDRDFFLVHYDEPIFENGIQHKDMLRLAMEF